MEILILVIAGGVLSVVVPGGIMLNTRLKRLYIESLIERLARAEEQVIDEARGVLAACYSGTFRFLRRRRYNRLRRQLEQAYNDAHVAFDYARRKDEVQQAYNAWTEASDYGDNRSLEALHDYLKALSNGLVSNSERFQRELGLSAAQATEILNRMAASHLEALLKKARQGDDAALLEANTLINETRRPVYERISSRTEIWYGGRYREVGAKPLQRPEDWNALVARHIRNPTLGNLETRNELSSGEALAMAADAERSGDLVQAVIVLAHWNDGSERAAWVRAEVPEVLIDRLAAMVAAAWEREHQSNS